jgi:hypothetical protein
MGIFAPNGTNSMDVLEFCFKGLKVQEDNHLQHHIFSPTLTIQKKVVLLGTLILKLGNSAQHTKIRPNNEH